MSSYKLSYFNGRGRAEVCRQMFKLKDVEFEDHRIEGTWKEEKPKTLFGQIPQLEVDGVTLCQSRAFERLVARRLGLYGADEMAQAKCDMVVDCAEDLLLAVFKSNQGTDEEKVEKKKKLTEETLPPMIANFEKFINSDGFCVSKEIMWADLSLVHMLTFIEVSKVDYDLSKHSKISALIKRVESNSKIAAWIKARPVSTF